MLRAKDRLTMKELGKEIGISSATICRIENGQTCDLRSLGKLIAWLFS